jgi:hypothetical protein
VSTGRRSNTTDRSPNVTASGTVGRQPIKNLTAVSHAPGAHPTTHENGAAKWAPAARRRSVSIDTPNPVQTVNYRTTFDAEADARFESVVNAIIRYGRVDCGTVFLEPAPPERCEIKPDAAVRDRNESRIEGEAHAFGEAVNLNDLRCGPCPPFVVRDP